MIEGQSTCDGVDLAAGLDFQLTVNIIACLLYLWGCMSVTPEHRTTMFLITFFPALDVLTDVNYVASTGYSTIVLFVCSFVFVLLPNIMFVHILMNARSCVYGHVAIPHLIYKYPGYKYINESVWWLSQRQGVPIGYNNVPWERYEYHDSIPKGIILLLTWVVAIALQCGCLVLYALWLICCSGFLCVWFVMGLWIFQNKTLAAKDVWNLWFRVWTGSNEFDKEMGIDVSILNESLLAEFATETLPQLTLQFINNEWSGTWTLIGYTSMLFSMIIVTNNSYRYVYWLGIRGVTMDELPAELSLMGLFKVRIQNENSNGMNQHIYSSKRGKLKILAKKVWLELVTYKRDFSISNSLQWVSAK